MEILEEKEASQRLVSQLLAHNLLPIIGSGFSRGSKTPYGFVPNGSELSEIMRNAILTHSILYKKDTLTEMKFPDLSDIFLDERIVPIPTRLEIFKKYFIGADLPGYKKDFLKIWPYIYTINVDDAIERATNYRAILPYAALRENSTNLFKKKGYVIKLHGDAAHEVESESTNLVFSFSQYIGAIERPENAGLIKSLRSDYIQKNLIFIGCSLEQEPDLKYIYDQVKNQRLSGGIYYLTTYSLNDDTILRLERYGVNTILKVNNYDAFYKNFTLSYNKSLKYIKPTPYPYINPRTQKVKSKESILDIFSFNRPIFNEKSGFFTIPEGTVHRNIIDSFKNHLGLYNFFILRGRRLSGKTIFIQQLINSLPDYTIIYVPSNFTLSPTQFNDMLENKKYFFIFDSNSCSPEIYNLFLTNKNKFGEYKNKAMIVSNSNHDNLIHSLNGVEMVLPQNFDIYEIGDFNRFADKLAFIKKDEADTCLDYSYKLMRQHNRNFLDQYNVSSMSDNEQILIYYLAVFDKIYFHEISALNISLREIENFIENYPLLFEIIEIAGEECAYKSNKKLVHNSKTVLYSLLSNLSNELVSQAIIRIVTNLYVLDPLQYKEAILFDTLNQLFSRKGAGELIDFIYQQLEVILYYEPHFWLQRAKSIYHLYTKDENKLNAAYGYAYKAFADQSEDRSLKMKSAFTLGLITSLLYNLVPSNRNRAFSAIEYIWQAFFGFQDAFLPNSVRNAVFPRSRSSSKAYILIVNLCNSISNEDDRNIWIKSRQIKEKLQELRQLDK